MFSRREKTLRESASEQSTVRTALLSVAVTQM